MANIFLVGIMICSCWSLINKDNPQTGKLKAVQVMQNFPIIDKSGKLLHYDTSLVNIYYYRNQVMYSDSYQWDSVVQGNSLKSENRRNYFVYTKGKTYGYLYDEHKSEKDKKVLIDSMLQTQWYNRTSYAPLFFNCTVTMDSQKNSNRLKTLNRFYSFVAKNDAAVHGSCVFTFSNNLNWINYSMSKIIDTIPGMKLSSIRVINNPVFFKESNITLDRIDDIFEMKEIAVIDPDEIMYYFEKEKKYNLEN